MHLAPLGISVSHGQKTGHQSMHGRDVKYPLPRRLVHIHSVEVLGPDSVASTLPEPVFVVGKTLVESLFIVERPAFSSRASFRIIAVVPRVWPSATFCRRASRRPACTKPGFSLEPRLAIPAFSRMPYRICSLRYHCIIHTFRTPEIKTRFQTDAGYFCFESNEGQERRRPISPFGPGRGCSSCPGTRRGEGLCH